MRVALAVVIGLVFCAISQAQDVLNNVTFGFGAGFSVPAGATRNHVQTGFNFTANGGPRFDSRFSATLDFSLHYFNLKNTLKDPRTLADPSLGARMRLWSLTVNPNYKFIRREKFSSYVTGGYGLYSRRLLLTIGLIPADVSDPFWNVTVSGLPPTVTGRLSTYKGGYNVGGGVTFGERTKFFTEVRYHHMFTTAAPTEIFPLTFGVRW
jgi:opacity protein-like surface antigen